MNILPPSPGCGPGPVYYLCAEEHAYTIGVFLEYYATPLNGLLRILPYEQLCNLGLVAPGPFIFTDFERLSPSQMQMATALHHRIAAQHPALPLLNNPAAALGRFELLKRLKAAGLNRFDVYRIGERETIGRFPVFLRWASQHVAPLSGLLHNADDLTKAIARLPAEIRGDPDLMIVEFGAAPSADGQYRKYSAFRVGEAVYAQHCFISSDWYVKYSNAKLSEAERAEHHDYVRENPHAERLKAIFDLARIEYGRIDYGLVDGQIQTFEINSNPTVNSRPPWWDAKANYAFYADLHSQAMLGLTRPSSGPPVRIAHGSRNADDVHRQAARRVRWRIRKLYFRRSISLRSLKTRLRTLLGRNS